MKRQSKMTEEKRKRGRISRREFIKDAGLIGAAIGSTALIATEPTKTATAQGTGRVELEVYDPCGAIRVTELHARRLDTLAGKTICEVSNGSWEDDRTFPVIRELLKKAYPTAKFIPYPEFPVGTTPIPAPAINAVTLFRMPTMRYPSCGTP